MVDRLLVVAVIRDCHALYPPSDAVVSKHIRGLYDHTQSAVACGVKSFFVDSLLVIAGVGGCIGSSCRHIRSLPSSHNALRSAHCRELHPSLALIDHSHASPAQPAGRRPGQHT